MTKAIESIDQQPLLIEAETLLQGNKKSIERLVQRVISVILINSCKHETYLNHILKMNARSQFQMAKMVYRLLKGRIVGRFL